jgi:hypothetical protein
VVTPGKEITTKLRKLCILQLILVLFSLCLSIKLEVNCEHPCHCCEPFVREDGCGRQRAVATMGGGTVMEEEDDGGVR